MIYCTGIRTNNLKNISVQFPENEITAITGISGSGKSSLAFDTIAAESQRTFLELMFPQLSSLGIKLTKPDLDELRPILPTISMRQTQNNNNPRSTIGTITDISQILRGVFSAILSYKGVNVSSSDFSANTSRGACPHCKGLGVEFIINMDAVLDGTKSIANGGVVFWERKSDTDYYKQMLLAACAELDIPLDIPIDLLSPDQRQTLFFGGLSMPLQIKYRNLRGNLRTKKVRFQGVLTELLRYKDNHSASELRRGVYAKYWDETECSFCKGKKINNQHLQWTIDNYDFGDLEQLPLSILQTWIRNVAKKYTSIAGVKIACEIMLNKIQNLIDCNLEYLSLNRSIPTLSGGEYQRLRLSLAVNSAVSNMLFIFDEPSAGLHPQDVGRVFELIKKIKELGNTILVVEHNNLIIKKCDYLIDIGPYAGADGGEVLYMGVVKHFHNAPFSLTSKYLHSFFVSDSRVRTNQPNTILHLTNLKYRNVEIDQMDIPCERLSVICGVSGSGKSTLLHLISKRLLSQSFSSISCQENDNSHSIPKISIITLDQKPISKNARSVVATYIGVFDDIREVFASCKLPDGKKMSSKFFSFNIDGGRCPVCKGSGAQKIQLDFLDETYVECPDCKGKRFGEQALSVTYNGFNISDILNLTISEALKVFSTNNTIMKKLYPLQEIGLGYIRLGQSSNTLSGGESQRIKISAELGKKTDIKNIYLLDEPLSGLHLYDIELILKALRRLTDAGNTVIVVDHTVNFIKSADFVMELGPGGGNAGGKLIASGSPSEIKENPHSIISKYL